MNRIEKIIGFSSLVVGYLLLCIAAASIIRDNSGHIGYRNSIYFLPYIIFMASGWYLYKKARPLAKAHLALGVLGTAMPVVYYILGYMTSYEKWIRLGMPVPGLMQHILTILYLAVIGLLIWIALGRNQNI